jgi:hypothetical protein
MNNLTCIILASIEMKTGSRGLDLATSRGTDLMWAVGVS